MRTFVNCKRGELLYIDFDPVVGSEIAGLHFGIVLDNRDNSRKELITVVPVTSKYNKSHLCIGNPFGSYSKYPVSYVKIKQVRTVSKKRIRRCLWLPKNKLFYVSYEILRRIDNELLKLYINSPIDK